MPRGTTANLQIPLTLRPSLAKLAWLFVTSLLFVLLGIWMVSEGEDSGYFCAGFFAIGLAVAMIQLHPKAAYLHLTSDGFTFCSMFRTFTVRWAHVVEFVIIRIHGISMIAWDFTADYSAQRRGRALSRFFCRYEAALPDTYGMKPQELLELMESLRQRFTQTQNADRDLVHIGSV